MDRVDQYGALDEEWQRQGLDRRRFLRLVAMGASVTTISSFIAACRAPAPASTTAAPSATQPPAATAAPTFVARTVGGTPTVIAAPTSAPLIDRPFLVALSVEPDSLDVQDTFFNASLGVDKCLYEGLVGLDQNMQIVNQLAESWEPSADARTFTFKLRSGIKFHDGTPFNAASVQAAFERVLASDAQLKRHGYFSAAIDHVEAVDDGTVRLVTKQPFAALVATIAHPAGGIPSPTAFKQYGQDFGTHPVGTGPFKFNEWVRGDHITLDAYPDYWDKARGASVSHLTIKGISDPSSLAIAVQSGGAQFAAPLNAAQAQQLQSASGVKVLESDSISVYWVTMNDQRKPFDNKLVRQALNYAVNKDAVLKVAELGKGKIVDSPMAAGVWGYKGAKIYEYDLQKAKDLLTQAGYPNGFSATLRVTAPSKDRAVAVQSQLQQIGVQVEVVQMETAAYQAEESKPADQSTTELLISNWSPSTGDADWALRSIYSKTQWPPAGANYGYFFNQQVEDLIMQGLQFTDETQRKEAYAKAQAMIMDEAPNIFLYAPTYFSAVRDNVGGAILQPDGIPYLRTAHYTA
jgi:glutathione transport system substrate-binding protein